MQPALWQALRPAVLSSSSAFAPQASLSAPQSKPLALRDIAPLLSLLALHPAIVTAATVARRHPPARPLAADRQ